MAAGGDAGGDRGRRRQIQDAFVLDTMRLLFIGAGLIFSVDTIHTGLTTGGSVRWIVLPLDMAVALAFFALHWLIAHKRIGPGHTHQLGALAMFLTTSNLLTHMSFVDQEPEILTIFGFVLIAVSSGIIFLERNWVIAMLGAMIASWSVALAANDMSVSWDRNIYLYVIVTLFTLFNFYGRKHAVRAMVDAQVENELQRSQLAGALERAHLSEARLRAERDFADQIIDSVGQGLILLDDEGRIEFVNPAAEKITGLPMDQLIGYNASDLIAEYEIGVTTSPHSERSQEMTFTTGEGDTRTFLVMSVDRPGGGRIATLTDLTLRKQLETNLEQLAHFDALTGLPNRRLFLDRLQQAIDGLDRPDAHLAVLFFDLDGFKPVNDSLGHSAGDKALIEIARRIESGIRGHDTAARFGGDEFVVLLSDLSSPEEALQIADRVSESIREPLNLGGQHRSLQASLGVVICHSAEADAEKLIERADIAMYHAKRRDDVRRVLFTPDMLAQPPAERRMTAESGEPADSRLLQR